MEALGNVYMTDGEHLHLGTVAISVHPTCVARANASTLLILILHHRLWPDTGKPTSGLFNLVLKPNDMEAVGTRI